MQNQLSFWERDSFFDRVDVAIIGSGIVGLSAAISLKKKQKNLNVIVLERGMIPMGASSKNAGFACFGSAGELLDDIKKQGEEGVFSLVEKRWKGLQRLRKNLGDKKIDFHNWGGYEVFDNQIDFEEKLEQIHDLNKNLGSIIGTKKVFHDATDKIHKFGFVHVKGMIFNEAEGQIDTGKMMLALIKKTWEHRIPIINGFEVSHLDESGSTARIRSKDGLDFEARKVLICTNGFAKQFLPDYPVFPARAQVLVTKPIRNLKLKGTFHYDEGYYYFRNIGNRILFGGGRNLDLKGEETAEFGITDLIQNRLDDLLQNMIIPGIPYETDIRWSGIMGVGPEKTTIIKAVSPRVFCAVRMGGMGVAIGSLVGEEAAEMLLGLM